MKSYKAKSNVFTGWLYPLFITALVLIGSLSGMEVYTAAINIAVVSIALLVSNTIKPFLFFLLTFAYQMPKEHLYPSDYYYTGDRPYIIVGAIAVLAISLIAFLVKNKIFSRVKISEIPLFIPLCVLALGWGLNGLLASPYDFRNLVWAALMLLVYFFLYVVVYLGLKGENPEKMVEYFTYMTFLMSWILIIHMCKLYFVDGVVVNGVIKRGQIVMGYGVCNLIGFHISTLIPMNFYGFMKGKFPKLSLITAFVLFFANIATTSRNSALVGSACFFFCLVLCLFVIKERTFDKIVIFGLVAACVMFGAALCYYWIRPEAFTNDFLVKVLGAAKAIMEQYFDRGLDSSGRTDIWQICVGIFKENPIFGAGFFGVQVAPQFVPEEFIPEYAHNTFFELIAATGIVGTLAYGFYRISTLKYMFHNFSIDRFMLTFGAMILAFESLLDNYVFHVYTTFYYVIAFAIAVSLYEVQKLPVCKVRVVEIGKPE